MTQLSFKCLILAIALGGTAVSAANRPAESGAASAAAMPDQHSVEKISRAVLKEVKLADLDKEAVVRNIVDQHLMAVAAWHAKVDPELERLWSDWAQARTPPHQDEAKAAGIAGQIDARYAEFRPQHDAFVDRLKQALTPAQLEGALNAFSKTPGFERTYHAYLEIVPALTEAQRAAIRDILVVARDQSVDTLGKQEKIDLFKKQKVKIQAYIDEQGYDWKKSYAAFAAKIKAQSASK